MSKNKFKKCIQDRYKGRGNTWVKVPFESKAYEFIQRLFDSVNDETKEQFIKHNKREGFSWMRYKKVAGDQENPITIFEVRIKGSKIDQPEYEVHIPDLHVADLDLLGNTPVKLQFETEVKVVKEKKQNTFSSKKSSSKKDSYLSQINQENVENEVKVIKEAALTKPTDKELSEWYTFLKANDLYEESAW
jgi:hypothetical protein